MINHQLLWYFFFLPTNFYNFLFPLFSYILFFQLLTRVRDSRSALERRQRKNARSEMTNENLTCVLEKYQRFIANFKELCLESIFPGSSPSRRSFALGGLALMKQLGIYGDYNQRSAEVIIIYNNSSNYFHSFETS